MVSVKIEIIYLKIYMSHVKLVANIGPELMLNKEDHYITDETLPTFKFTLMR